MKKQDVAHSRQRKTRNKDPKAIATLGVPLRKGLLEKPATGKVVAYCLRTDGRQKKKKELMGDTDGVVQKGTTLKD